MKKFLTTDKCLARFRTLRNDVKLVMYGENGELEYGGDINTLNFKGMPNIIMIKFILVLL